ncbi:uncharacterized protein [Euphorbia lathyris]|uniref:uncharacterized protein n=1 Tax=Euphorbia lathyris TaxID=212925 RepID=UPI00331368AC
MANNVQHQTEPDSPAAEPKARQVGGTEYSWCKAVPSGTGITVLALLLSKQPDISRLQNTLHLLQISHPILRSKLHFDAAAATFSFLTPPSPHLRVQLFDLSSTSAILSNNPNPSSINPHHFILEHEMNQNPWLDSNSLQSELNLFFMSVYTLSENRWAVVLRIHSAACDRASAAALLREMLQLVTGGGEVRELGSENDEIGMKIEDCIPKGKANKPFWVRGMDFVGYSLNSFRLSNLNFVDSVSPRCSQVLRLQMNSDQTRDLIEGCKSRGIKLCGALAAAGLIAAHSSKDVPDNQSQKYGVVTLVDCRSILDPVISIQHLGFYHSAIMNSHDISRGDNLWEVAKRCYMSFTSAMNNNKHFTDMADLNFLMGKAIDNPGLTPSSSSRTAFLSVFEDPVMDDSTSMHQQLGVEDYVGCASVHGIGPSVALFDTIRDGCLDCACVYPAPLHSREQMQKLVDDMKRILVDCCANVDEGES